MVFKKKPRRGQFQTRLVKTAGAHAAEESAVPSTSTLQSTSVHDYNPDIGETFTLPHSSSEDTQMMDYLVQRRQEEAAIESSRLNIEYVRAVGSDKNIGKLNGNRLVDIAHIITKSRRLESHICSIDTQGYLSFYKEISHGFSTTLIFKCTSCSLEKSIITVNEDSVNNAVVWSSVASGRAYTAVNEMFTMLEMPCISELKYKRLEIELGASWLLSLTDGMMEAGAAEWKIAEENGMVDKDGIGSCTVVIDGGWSHRSYGHSYTAKSGVACIVGVATKKLLHIGIKNKYCSICSIAGRRALPVQQHACYKNWSGSSPAMEAAVLVEGFCNSEAMHKLQYLKYVGDGDSSVERKLKEQVSYGRFILKIECANHMVKNVTKHLHNLAKESTHNKKLLSNIKINILGKTARKVIAITSKLEDKSVHQLRTDLKNVPLHVFGNHTTCRSILCDTVGNTATIDALANAPIGTVSRMHSIFGTLVAHAPTLIENATSNLAEQFMSLVAKFTGGKRAFYSRRNSFNTRCLGAGLLYQYGPNWMQTAWKDKILKSPGNRLKRLIATRNRRRQYIKPRVRRRIVEKDADVNNADYGDNCQCPDLPDCDIKDKIDLLLLSLEVDRDKQHDIQLATKEQRLSERWLNERTQRITASSFGAICRRTLRPGILVKQILYGTTPQTVPIQYGIQNEGTAIQSYECLFESKVTACGLFVKSGKGEGFLGASPDGLIGDHGIIEVKCPYSARMYTPEDACRMVKLFYCSLDEGNIKLNRKHI